MKKLFFILLALLHISLAQDSSDTFLINQPAKNTSSDIVKRLIYNDFQKFYIGFSSTNNSIEVITLDIINTQPTDSSISFHYTMNTKNTREEGIGEIIPESSLIRFQNMEEGRISVPADGKIIIESVTKDSLNYWKLKEK